MLRGGFWIVSILLLATDPALAVSEDSNATIESLEARIEALEASGGSSPLTGRLHLGGIVELEARWSKTESEDPTSDLVVASALLSAESQLNERVGGHIVLLYEEGGTGLDVDEAVISLTCPGPLAGMEAGLNAGKLYLPFGHFETHLISDPLTLELGETNDTAARFSLTGGMLEFRLAVFNGETDALGDDDVIDSLAAALDLEAGEGVEFGVSWINDLAESDNGLVTDAAGYGDSVAGFSAFASFERPPFHLGIEYLGALERFDPQVVDAAATLDPDNPGDLTGRKPLAFNLELALELAEEFEVAVRYEQADDFRDDLVRYGVAGSYGLFEGTVLALEYLHGETDTPDSVSHTVTAQLALEF